MDVPAHHAHHEGAQELETRDVSRVFTSRLAGTLNNTRKPSHSQISTTKLAIGAIGRECGNEPRLWSP